MTQFEALTAAAFVALAAARVECGVIEAGLGGRLDATNVIPSQVTVLTSVGLEHTEWLGETEEEIAAEKLAVLRDHSTLIRGQRSRRRSSRSRANRAARSATADRAGGPEPRPRLPLPVDPYPRRNFAVAQAAAAGGARRARRRRASRRGRRAWSCPGRMRGARTATRP